MRIFHECTAEKKKWQTEWMKFRYFFIYFAFKTQISFQSLLLFLFLSFFWIELAVIALFFISAIVLMFLVSGAVFVWPLAMAAQQRFYVGS